MSEPVLLFVDLFCGAGGTTTGIEHAKCFDKKVAKVIACVNHDENAIASHRENHPDCIHFTEDIRTVDLTEVATILRHNRVMNPNAKFALWASLECTEYSKAKGGIARDADSRTLANYLPRYLDAAEIFCDGFDYVFVENVVEFMKGGPMRIKPKKFHKDRTELFLIKDKKTKQWKYGWEPIPETRGLYYRQWVERMKSYGYEFEHKLLNSADFGAHTSRTRYFGVFAKKGLPIKFPTPTHSKKPTGTLKKWRPVKEVLDFSDEGESIFTRKKDLAERTMQRIYAGLVKYIALGDTSFIQKYYSGRPKGKVNSTEEPCSTITTAAGLTLVQPTFMLKYNSTNKKTGKHIPPSIEDPSPALSTQGRLGLVNTKFIAYYYGSHTLSSVDEPCQVLRTKDGGSLVQPEFWIDRQYNGEHNHSSIESPIGALPTFPKANLASAWILSPHFNNNGSSVEEPMKVITANRKHHCLMFPQWGVGPQCSHSVDKPSPVLPARMDKMMPQFVVAEETGTPIAIAIFDDDREIVKKIKMFMAAYGIVDIKMRMLRIPELKKITGFGEDYVLKGNQQEQKKYIGNAVPVLLAKAIIESFAEILIQPIKKAA